MRIAGVASAFPKYYYNQELLVAALKNYWRDRLPNPDILDRLDESMKVDGRYLVRPISFYESMTTWGEANDVWIESALELGEKALCRALVGAGLQPRELSAIFVTSVTGIAAPSLDARLANRMGLSPNIKRIPIFGLGCVAGAAGIARAADYVRGLSGPGGRAALGRTVFAHAAARRSFHGALDFGAAVRRRRRGDHRCRIRSGIRRPGNPGHQVDSLSQFGTRDGLGHLRKGLPHRTVTGSSRHRAEAPRRRCGRVPGRAWTQTKRH